MNKHQYILLNVLAVVISLGLIRAGGLLFIFGAVAIGYMVYEWISGGYKKYIK